MPVMGGLEATEKIRNNIPKYRQPIIIALTADAFKDTKERCLECGMQDVLTKPIDKQALITMLQRCAPQVATLRYD
jgi:CheY-like chemotaxis protein